MSRKKVKGEWQTTYYTVDAVFGDGTRIPLKEFQFPDGAHRWLQANAHRDFYPKRVYRLEMSSYIVEDFLAEQ
jgi:hypothetical protein